MKEFMAESLREQQQTILALMERAARARVPEASSLDWALESVVTAQRDLSAGRIDWLAAMKVYQAASNATLECDSAVFDMEHITDAEWQMAKLRAEASMEREVQ